MKRSTTMWLGLSALAGAVAGGVAYYLSTQKTAAASTPPASVPAGPTATAGLVASFAHGRSYGLAAQLPVGVTDQTTLVQQLNAAGWQNVQIVYFGPNAGVGVVPPGLPITPVGTLTTAYVATGTWTGADATPVPVNVSAVQLT